MVCHALGRWQKRSSNNSWVRYVEELVKFILLDKHIKRISADLKDVPSDGHT